MKFRLLTAVTLVLVILFSGACSGDDADPTQPDPVATLAATPTTQSGPTTASTMTEPTSTTRSQATTSLDVLGVVCEQDLVAGFQNIGCEEMSFDVALPGVCNEGGCGLIVDVHGYTGNGALAEQHTGMQALGNDAGYVVVQPNNTKDSWDPKVDDDRVRSFMDQLIDGLALDINRVHIGGFSQGGWMTWRFVCDNSDLIASAAPAGAGASYPADEPVSGVSCDFDAESLPAAQVDILYIHGRSDSDVPFETAVEQRDLVVSAWEMVESDIVADEPDYLWTRWASPKGTVFEFLEHDWRGGFLGGHCYPGGSGKVGCGTDTPVNYGEAALQFYIDHPKNP